MTTNKRGNTAKTKRFGGIQDALYELTNARVSDFSGGFLAWISFKIHEKNLSPLKISNICYTYQKIKPKSKVALNDAIAAFLMMENVQIPQVLKYNKNVAEDILYTLEILNGRFKTQKDKNLRKVFLDKLSPPEDRSIITCRR